MVLPIGPALFPAPCSQESSVLKPIFRAGRQRRWKRFLLLLLFFCFFCFFFFPYFFFHFSCRENRSGVLRWPWRGVPKSLVPIVLSRAVHSFCCLHARGRVEGLHLICVSSPLRCQSYDKGPPPSPNFLHMLGIPASQCLMASEPQKPGRQLCR